MTKSNDVHFHVHCTNLYHDTHTKHEAPDFKSVQKSVSDIITGRKLVGHGIQNDLKVSTFDCLSQATSGLCLDFFCLIGSPSLPSQERYTGHIKV